MPAARVQAQAKINVWLRVTGQRPDGFHDLHTLFQRIALADDVVVRTDARRSRTIDVAGPRLPAAGLGPAERNLAYRAAEAYQARAGWPRGFAIELTKHIPVGGGLGGGSADAGAVLRALNAMCPTPLGAADLHAVAAPLGADVAFLAGENAAAIGTGRGDQLAAFESPSPEAELLLVVPRFAIATPDAYRWLRERGAHQPFDVSDTARTASPTGARWKTLDHGNTFEQVVEARYPELRAWREALEARGAAIARLSGSGSTVFGLFDGGLPDVSGLRFDAEVIRSRTASRVVQVEVAK